VNSAKELHEMGVFSEEQFELARSIFTELSGNQLKDEKRALVESRLRKRLLDTGLSIDEYLQTIQVNQEEQSIFISSLTTHKTDWFREPVHFGFLRDVVCGKIQTKKEKADAKSWTIWSAASSTGEECYSLAMTLEDLSGVDYRILGTDISESCLEKATKGVYPRDVVDKQVAHATKVKYFLRGSGAENKNLYRISPEISKNIKFRHFNLVDSTLTASVEFDFIFLRNALIYFDEQGSHAIIERLMHYLRPGGFFIVGLSETIKHAERLGLKRLENSVYQKC
jgi:chemotaxis protein methyltransferase CheR